MPPVPPPALPGSRGGGGTGKPRGAPRERHLKGRTTAGEGGAVKGGGGTQHSPKPGGGSGRQASKQTHKQTKRGTGAPGAAADRGRARGPRGWFGARAAPPANAARAGRGNQIFQKQRRQPTLPRARPPGITSSHKAPRAQEASEGGGWPWRPAPGPRAEPWPRLTGDGAAAANGVRAG